MLCSLLSLSKRLKARKSQGVKGLLVTQDSPRSSNLSVLGSRYGPLILLLQEDKTEKNSGLTDRHKEQEES